MQNCKREAVLFVIILFLCVELSSSRAVVEPWVPTWKDYKIPTFLRDGSVTFHSTAELSKTFRDDLKQYEDDAKTEAQNMQRVWKSDATKTHNSKTSDYTKGGINAINNTYNTHTHRNMEQGVLQGIRNIIAGKKCCR